MGTAEITLVFSGIVMVCAVLTFVFNRSSESGKREYWQGQTTNQLAAIGEDVKDMKAQQRTYERQLNETRAIALEAKNAANSAHQRLDAIDAPRKNRE